MDEQTRWVLLGIRNAYMETISVIGLIRIGFDPDTDSIDRTLGEVVAPLRKVREVLPEEIKRTL